MPAPSGYGYDYPDYYLDWISKGAKHGTLGGKVLNEAAVRSEMTPWSENIYYDAAGNPVSLYRDARAGEVSPYGPIGTGPSAPEAPAGAAGYLAELARMGYFGNKGDMYLTDIALADPMSIRGGFAAK